MATSEIEKLERRYAENPHGLTFAPLAEVHRKNGDVARALELLTAGLELHPNYIPASIVLGRCHQDLGDLPAAEAAFAHVLRLDDENVIALKCLADINERQENLADAETWLRRLVSVDRSNEEAREQLRRLDERKKAAAEAPPEAVVASAPALEVLDLGPEPVTDHSESPVSDEEPQPRSGDLPPADVETLELNAASERAGAEADWVEGTPAVAAAETVEADAPVAPAAEVSEEPVSAGDAVAPVTGLISAEFVPPLQAIGGLGVETSEDVVLEVSGNSEFRVPDASEDFTALADRQNAPPQRTPAPEPSESAPRSGDDGSRARDEPVHAPPTPVPDEERTLGKPAGQRSYVARETNGRSVASFFHSLLAARPPTEGNPGGPGAGAGTASPSAAAGAHVSSAADDNQPTPPAMAAADQKADGAVSFDDFFGSEPEGSAPLRQHADPGEDDLDQFQTWLQNLKR